MRLYPAIEIRGGDHELIAAVLDDFSPTAIEEGDEATRAFFANADARDAARAALAIDFQVAAIDVSDDDWARRSQEHLQPITVGRLTIAPDPDSAIRHPPSAILIIIRPSMGFGTGHHATTRLCLDALQQIEVGGKHVLDIGTGSGVLAIAADRLGAADAIGIDVDADAVQSARENLELNPEATHVRFEVADLAAVGPAIKEADVVLANLTGALLIRAAATLLTAVRPGGVVIVSGLQSHEREDVVAALHPEKILWHREEDSWVGLAMRKSAR